ncbi:MAG: restriction endonuclease [Chloroherpetonaceae bacterium]|nr:restriction endonuclease [Chloroherpetonaceae bacterium]
MNIPKFHETLLPILKTLSDGKTIHYNDLRKKVRDTYYGNLSTDLLELETKSGDPIVLNRIGWGKAYLKQAKMVEYPERGLVRITEKGRKILEKGSLTLKELKLDKDYVEHEKIKKIKKETEGEDDNFDLENDSPQDLIDKGISAIDAEVKAELLEKLKNIDPYYFEKVILKLLNKMGYGDIIETSKSRDGGIDGIINEDKLGLEKIYIQAKKYTENKVREKDIREFIGAMSGDTTKGIFVTTSDFDEAAIKKAKEAHHKIVLINGSKLVDLMHQFTVGFQIKNVYEVKQIDEEFFENS